jgi:hypothetical protein
VPGASRVCLNGFGEENGLTAIRRRRSKSANTVACKHRLAGLPPPNQSLTAEEVFWPASRAGYCSLPDASDLPAASARACLRSLGASRVLVSPAANLAGEPVGTVLIIWDGDSRRPEETELIAPMALGVRVGGQIAAVLELCHHASTRLPSASAELNHSVCALPCRDTAGRGKAGIGRACHPPGNANPPKNSGACDTQFPSRPPAIERDRLRLLQTQTRIALLTDGIGA